jgi:adenylate cyclase
MEIPERTAVAAIVVRGPDGSVNTVTIPDRLFVGRVVSGTDPERSLLLPGEEISRHHCEIRLQHDARRATIVDTSTNGTRLNGSLIERSVPTTLVDGDILTIGPYMLVFASDWYVDSGRVDSKDTLRRVLTARVAIVVGDLVSFSALTQARGGEAVGAAVERVFDEVRTRVTVHRGSLLDYAGDAFMAVWECERFDDAAARAVAFALDAARAIDELAPMLDLRQPDGTPLGMGWAVTLGDVALSALVGPGTGAFGDVVNLAFRLAGIAGRGGRASVMLTEDVYQQLHDVEAGPPEEIAVKGRTGATIVREIRCRS